MSLQISLVFVSDRLHSREDSERKEGSPASCLKLMTCHNNMETGTKRHIPTTPCRGITWRVLATVRSYVWMSQRVDTILCRSISLYNTYFYNYYSITNPRQG